MVHLRKQWKGINHKQSTRWQHLSQLKASEYFSLQKFLVVMTHSNLCLGLVLPSGGWQSLIVFYSLLQGGGGRGRVRQQKHPSFATSLSYSLKHTHIRTHTHTHAHTRTQTLPLLISISISLSLSSIKVVLVTYLLLMNNDKNKVECSQEVSD